MEIDITDFVLNCEPYDFSGSVAERGPMAGPQTWANARKQAETSPMLDTEDKLDAMRHWASETGAWDEAEREAMDDETLNALFIQLVSGDMREAGMDEDDMENFDWEAYQAKAEEGRISGNIYKGGDRYYFTLSD